MRRFAGGVFWLLGLVITIGSAASQAAGADGVWPPAVRYEAFLRAVEVVSTGELTDLAALDAAYRTYLGRAGELRAGHERAYDGFTRVLAESAGLDELDRAWNVMRQAESRASLAERELADRIRELVPDCSMSASGLTFRLRLVDAFARGGEASTPFAALLLFRPAVEDRRVIVEELERLLPIAERYLREGMELAIERQKAYVRYRAEVPPPAEDASAAEADEWADGWRERRFPAAKADGEREERFTQAVEVALERLLGQLTPPSGLAIERAWNRSRGASDVAHSFLVPWRGVTADASTIAAARERVGAFLARDREEAKAFRRAAREDGLTWMRLYAELDQPVASEIRAAERQASEVSTRLQESMTEIASRRLSASNDLLAELKVTLGGAPSTASGSERQEGEILLVDEVWRRSSERRAIATDWRGHPEVTLPHRWLWPSVPQKFAGDIAARLGREESAGALAIPLAALNQTTSAAVSSLREVKESTMGLAPAELAEIREEIAVARRAVEAARTACIAELRRVAVDEREQAIIGAAIVEHFGGDPVACTMSRSLQPWDDRTRQFARHGNPAWAVERAELDQASRELARAVIARHADELLKAMDAYDREEVDATLEACSWPLNEEEVGDPHTAEAAIRRASLRVQATARLDAAADLRHRACEKAREALRAAIAPEAFERIRQAELLAVAPDLPQAFADFQERLERAKSEAVRRDAALAPRAQALVDEAIAQARAIDAELASIAWRPEAFHLWWPNVDLGAAEDAPDASPGRRERRKWLLFVRDETRVQWMTAMERLGPKGQMTR